MSLLSTFLIIKMSKNRHRVLLGLCRKWSNGGLYISIKIFIRAKSRQPRKESEIRRINVSIMYQTCLLAKRNLRAGNGRLNEARDSSTSNPSEASHCMGIKSHESNQRTYIKYRLASSDEFFIQTTWEIKNRIVHKGWHIFCFFFFFVGIPHQVICTVGLRRLLYPVHHVNYMLICIVFHF